MRNCMVLPTHVKTDTFWGRHTNMISFPFGKGNNRGYYFSTLTWHIIPKCSGLRQLTWIISQLLWSGILAQPSWVFWPQSSEGWTREGPTFQLMQLLVGFNSSQFLRLRASVLLWLLGRGFLQFLDSWASHTCQCVSSKSSSQENNRSSLLPRWMSHITFMTSSPLSILFIRRKSSGPMHTQRGGITQGHEHQGGGDRQSHPRSSPQTCLTGLTRVFKEIINGKHLALGR